LASSKSHVVGKLERRTMDFDVWSVGEEDADGVVGEEIRQLSCLVPRKKKGKLYPGAFVCPLPSKERTLTFDCFFISAAFVVPRGIARRLVVSAGPAKPQAPSEEAQPAKNSNTGKYQNPPRQIYPDELLTHSFAPYGSYTAVGPQPESKDVDMDEPEDEELEPPPPAQPRRDPEDEAPKQKEKKSKGRKRKGDGEDAAAPAPKKSKKSKSSAS
jgi:hypothetical protein